MCILHVLIVCLPVAYSFLFCFSWSIGAYLHIGVGLHCLRYFKGIPVDFRVHTCYSYNLGWSRISQKQVNWSLNLTCCSAAKSGAVSELLMECWFCGLLFLCVWTSNRFILHFFYFHATPLSTFSSSRFSILMFNGFKSQLLSGFLRVVQARKHWSTIQLVHELSNYMVFLCNHYSLSVPPSFLSSSACHFSFCFSPLITFSHSLF